MHQKISTILLTAALSVGFVAAYAQSRKAAAAPKKQEETKRKDNLNRIDEQNRKQGLWFYEYEARMGEPHYYEYGSYRDDKKSGVWTKLDSEQQLMATETYSRGMLNGVSQYYENGKLVAVGTYRGLYSPNKYDTIWVTNPATDIDSLVSVPTEWGYTRHGIWRYYDAATGQLTREEEYQVDNLIYEREFHHVTRTDSARIQKRIDNLPHNKKVYSKPPAGKVKSLIY